MPSEKDKKATSWQQKLTGDYFRHFAHFDRGIQLAKKAVEHPDFLRWVLVVLGIYLSSQLMTHFLALLIRPTFHAQLKHKPKQPMISTALPQNYDLIMQRNIFNVEGKIPDPFDQGMMDCFSQAKQSQAPITLLGTIVMGEDHLSTALIEEASGTNKFAVKPGEFFFNNQYQVIKIDRKRLCFMVSSNQEYEYIEVSDTPTDIHLGVSNQDGIIAHSDTNFTVKKSFINDKLNQLTELLQTAKADPYIEGGQFKGFVIQSVDPSSPFAQLGIRPHDILTGVNDIELDNQGKGLEAFNQLRNSPKIILKVMRNGQPTIITYDVGG